MQKNLEIVFNSSTLQKNTKNIHLNSYIKFCEYKYSAGITLVLCILTSKCMLVHEFAWSKTMKNT